MLTIGHSTLPIEIFIRALKENSVELLVDVRTVPRSRHNPQFGTEAVSTSLRDAGIEYLWMQALGGLRRPRKDSINSGWRNDSFRGYADYMQTEEFAAAVQELVALDDCRTTAVMCSEAVPWRCHRSLIGDALLVRNQSVEDIFVASTGKTQRTPHKLTSFARFENGRLWYPDPQALPFAEPMQAVAPGLRN